MLRYPKLPTQITSRLMHIAIRICAHIGGLRFIFLRISPVTKKPSPNATVNAATVIRMYFIQSPFLLNHYTTSDYHFQSRDTYKCSVKITKTVCQKNELIGIFRSERQLSLDNHLRSDIIRIDSLYVFMEVFMLINSDTIFSMTQANQNFSQVARTVDKSGEAVIFKNNKPKYLVVDIDDNERMLDLTDDEKIEIVAKRILKKYIGAFKELAK